MDGFNTAYVCKQQGGIWSGFDISGHLFLLLHSSLVIMEELVISGVLDEDDSPKPNGENTDRQAKSVFGVYSMIGGGILMSIWWGMMMVTCLYFHPIAELFSGSILGIMFWYLIYV
jgi:hypothetical protein